MTEIEQAQRFLAAIADMTEQQREALRVLLEALSEKERATE